jgi:hypothetical protein
VKARRAASLSSTKPRGKTGSEESTTETNFGKQETDLDNEGGFVYYIPTIKNEADAEIKLQE